MPIEHAGPVILAAFANDHSNAAHFLRSLSVEAERIRAALEPAHQLCPLVLLPSATLEGILDAQFAHPRVHAWWLAVQQRRRA